MSAGSTPDLDAFERRLGYAFRNRRLLAAALTHASALPPGAVQVAEQFEFLGDAVLDLAVAHLLWQADPDRDEGCLSKRRALLVKSTTLAAKARELGIGLVLHLGRGEDRSGGRTKRSILAAAYESVLGAIFLDGGFASVEAVVRGHFAAELAAGDAVGAQDWKTMLQERTQAVQKTVPEYRIVEEHGPAHARWFACEVAVAGEPLARGEGPSKREAQQQAARLALQRLHERDAAG
jgi:ribonuclease-3